jgi:carbon-monoxide dehydrogenase medium subunit
MSFDYYEPTTIKEALTLLDKHHGEVKVLAGGTDLVAKMKESRLSPGHVIHIGLIKELYGISSHNGNGLVIKPMTVIREIEQNSGLYPEYSVLPDAAKELADPSIRNMATIGGNLINAAPSADMAPPLIVLSATVKLVKVSQERVIPVEQFFTGPYSTLIAPDELMVEISVPAISGSNSGVYLKHHMRGGKGLGSIGIAVNLNVDSGFKCEDIKVAIGAVAPVPMRAFNAEHAMKGQIITAKVIEEAARAASEECNPRDSIRGSADYKRAIVKSLFKEAIAKALDLAKLNYGK